MNSISVPVVMMAAVCCYVGIYYLVLFFRRSKDVENLAFSMLSLSIALYDLFSAGLYNASCPAEGMFWQRFQFASLDLFSLSFLWFSYLISGRRFRAVYMALGTTTVIFFVLMLTVFNGLTFSLERPMPRSFTVWGLADVTYNESEPGPLCTIQYIVMMAGFIWILIRMIVNYRQKPRILRPVIVAFSLFFIAAANDVLVGAGVYNFIYVIEYVYMIIVLTMAYLLLSRFVHLYHQVESMNVTLERRVSDRTNELECARKKLEETNHQLVLTRDELWGEMELAKKIQTVLLPRKTALAGYDITAYMRTAETVGGDYYDIIHAGGIDWIIIGDVSGHGVAAGLVMMMAQTSIHTAVRMFPGIKPLDLITAVNNAIFENTRLMNENRFMTMTVMACTGEGKFHFSGIHQDIMIYRADAGTVELVETSGIWLGVLKDIASRSSENSFTLYGGDVLLLHTDGITEARDREGKEFSQERLERIFGNCGTQTPDEIRDCIIRALEPYECMDDVTMVVIKKK